jgi:hypothetical protein
MIGTIRKHSTWLWLVIIAVVIVSFISWQSPSSRYGAGRGGENFGSIDGERITRDQYSDAQREVYLQYFFRHGSWPDRDTGKTDFDEQRETYQWLFFIQKLKEYNISVDSESVARTANNILRNIEDRNHVPADAFMKQHADDLERYIRHELGREQLFSVIGLGGDLVKPEEAQYLYEEEHQELSTEAVFFSGSNYLAGVTAPSAAALAQFYTNEMSVYRVPDRVQVSYVAFGVTNLLAGLEKQMTNLAESVEINFRKLGTNYSYFGKTPAEARVKIREKLIYDQALAAARKQANEFANVLFDVNPVRADNLDALAKTNGLSLKLTRPFDQENGPAEFDGGPNFAKVAFTLTADEPFAGQPLVGDNAVYVIALNQKIPSEIPPLERLRDRVAADYRYSQAVLLARHAGETLVSAATNGLARGKTFAAVCADIQVKPVIVPAFSLSTQELPAVENYVPLTPFKRVAFSTPPGRISAFYPTHEGGLVVYVKQRLPIDPASIRAGLQTYFDIVRRTRQQEAINAWFMVEGPKSLRDTPLSQPKPAPLPGGPGNS